MYFPPDEYHDRWERAYASLEAEGLESAVVFGRSAGTHEKCADVLYLTNYYSNQSGHSDDDDWIGSVGVEQNVIVGAAGNEILTTTPLEWW